MTDIQVLHDKGKLIPADWQARLPNRSSPWYSTMAFLVRKGNPKNIQDWSDLARPDVKLVFPNPKTSAMPATPIWLHGSQQIRPTAAIRPRPKNS